MNKDIKKEIFKKDLMNLIETNNQINMTSGHSVSSNTHFFLYKNIVYKNIQAHFGQKIKNILTISSASVLAIVFFLFCFLFSKILFINGTLLI